MYLEVNREGPGVIPRDEAWRGSRGRASGHASGRQGPVRALVLGTGPVLMSELARRMSRAGSDNKTPQAGRGAYMMTATPTRHSSAPTTSHRSGRKPSTAMPHSSEPATNTPP